MPTAKFKSWQDGDAWLGYLEDFPDYWTQGETSDGLIAHLDDLERDLCGTPEGSAPPPPTAADLAQSGLVGLWADREDIGDPRDLADELRRQAESRPARPDVDHDGR